MFDLYAESKREELTIAFSTIFPVTFLAIHPSKGAAPPAPPPPVVR